MKEEKLRKIEEVEAKLRKLEKKGYKLMAELKAIEPYENCLSYEYAKRDLANTIEWSNKVIGTAREWAYKDR